MTKIPVLPGVWWVEIPQSDLRILCGSPMDIVKHLIMLGLVKKTESGSVSFETGPNAVLLSEKPVQNGRLWNLVEFPVLHMMYRQGMALPGHPGNTGVKPLIIGCSEQLECALSYIHRGTYGLTSRREMRRFGLPAADIDNLWRLKLKFAAGEIRSIDGLVDTAVVDGEPGEIAPGVLLSRLGDNRCRFSAGGEHLEVDMNIPEGEDWSPSYSLPRRTVDDADFSVVHIGEGNGWDPARPCMGSLLNHRGRRFLIDSGPGIDYSLNALGMDINDIDGLFLSHAHDDHFAGISQLLNREKPLAVYAVEPVMATVRMKLASLMGSDFHFADAFFRVQNLRENRWNDIDGLQVRPVGSPHPLETTIFFFRVRENGRTGTYAHLADIISRSVMDGFTGGNGVSSQYTERIFTEYACPADVKKVDAGGGLIHGAAADFAGDNSGKLILSHTEGYVAESDRAFGVAVDFGDNDIIIPPGADTLRNTILRALELSPLGNARKQHSEILALTPEILPSGAALPDTDGGDTLGLLLSGSIEASLGVTGSFTDDQANKANKKSLELRYRPGTLIGEAEALRESPGWSRRAGDNASVLPIPRELYRRCLGPKLLERRRRILSRRESIIRGDFFRNRLSAARIDLIAENAESLMLGKGRGLKTGRGSADVLYLVLSGDMRLHRSGRQCSRQCGASSSLNWQRVRPGAEPAYRERWIAGADSQILAVPGAVIRSIPILCRQPDSPDHEPPELD